MSEKTTLVGPMRAAQKRARARAVPSVAQRAARVRAAITETDRAYAGSLAAIRHAADLTQVQHLNQLHRPRRLGWAAEFSISGLSKLLSKEAC